MRKFGKWVSSKDAGGIISRRAKFHFVSRPAKKTQFLLCPERVIPCVHETFFHWFSAFGAVHSIPSCFSQNKTPLSQQRDKGDEKPLRYHSFCRGADTPAAQDCPVTGADRRGLLRVQPSAPRGCRPSPPVRLAPNGGSLCVSEAGTCPYPRMFTLFVPYLIRFPQKCQGKSGEVRERDFNQSSRKFNWYFFKSMLY